MAELDTITIKGFKSIASAEVKLGAINVVIGPNGSGKSNFLEFFRFLKAILAGELEEYVGRRGLQNVLHFGPKVTEALKFELTLKKAQVGSYSLQLIPGENGLLIPSRETIQDAAGKPAMLERHYKEAGASLMSQHVYTPDDPVPRLKAAVDSWMSFHLHDTTSFAKIRQPCPIDDNRQLRTDGSNLPAFLHLLRHKYPASYALLRNTVQRVAPFFDDFLLAPLALNESQIKLEWKHRDQDQYFDAQGLSDGTLRFIALTTLFLQPKELRPALILVDEPELGLHPFAISLLGSMIKSASVDTQIIVATQSPQLLDEFAPEDVLVAERDGHATTFRRLDENSLETWLEDYSLGELWEKNQLGGRPKPWRA